MFIPPHFSRRRCRQDGSEPCEGELRFFLGAAAASVLVLAGALVLIA